MTYSYTYSRYTHTYTHTRWQCCCGSWWCMILQQSCLTRYIIVSFACCSWCFIFLSFLYEFKQTTSRKTWPRLKRLWIVARSRTPSLLMLLHSSAPHKHPPSTNKSEYTNSHTSDTRLRIHHHRYNNHHRHTFGFVMLLRLLTFTSNDDVFAGMCISHRR